MSDDGNNPSWFRRMRATLVGAARSPEGRAALETAALRADLELVLRPDAEVAALWMANIAPLLATLQSMGDAVIYLGSVLIVKSGGETFVYKLTAHQQLILNNSPHLLTSPERILRTLGTRTGDGGSPRPFVGPEKTLRARRQPSGDDQPAADGLPATEEPGVPESSTAVDRPYRRSLVQAFADGVGGVFDIFGGTRRQRWSRPPAFEDMLAADARELCRELGLTPDGGNGFKEGTNR